MQYKISHTFNMYIKHVYFISYNSILSIIIFNNNNILIIWFTFLIKKNFFKFLLNNNYNSYNNLFNNFRINYQWYNSEIKTSINDISLQFTIYNKFFLPPPLPPPPPINIFNWTRATTFLTSIKKLTRAGWHFNCLPKQIRDRSDLSVYGETLNSWVTSTQFHTVQKCHRA